MAFPKLLQKLFQNNGAGDKLNQDIIPDIPYSKVTDAPSVDSALSSTSENPVQNKVINSALDGKLSTSGGTVSGAVTFNGKITASELKRSAGQKELIIGGADNDGCVQLFPGESERFDDKKSASLFLTSTGYTGNTIAAGQFILSAMDTTTGRKSLVGYPNGSLTWCGKSLTGGLTVVAESYGASSWYRKYSDGWIEQGGLTNTMSNASKLTLNTPFRNTTYTFVAEADFASYNWSSISTYERTTTSVMLSIVHGGNAYSSRVSWYACGF